MSAASKSGKKGRKLGRNAAYCKQYRDQGRRLKNKRLKVRRHAKRFPDDKQAARWLEANG